MVKVVGMGPGDIRFVTQDAIETIKDATCVIAFGRIAQTARQIVTEVTEVKSVREIKHHLKANVSTAILASGDPCFYGIVEYLKKNEIEIQQIIPGLSSFQYLMCQLSKSWQNAFFLSLHGRKDEIEKVLEHPLTILLTDRNHPPGEISQALYETGARGKMWAGFDLSYPEEKIVPILIGESMTYTGGIVLVVIELEKH